MAGSSSKFSLAEFIALLCAVIILVAFILPWVPNLNGFQLLSQVPGNTRLFSALFCILAAAISGGIAAIWGLADPTNRHSTAVGALVAGLAGLWFYVLVFLQSPQLASTWYGTGFWVALVGAIGLVIQYWLPRTHVSGGPETTFLSRVVFWVILYAGVWAMLQVVVPMPPSEVGAGGTTAIGGLTNDAFRERLRMLMLLIVGLGGGTILLEVVLYWFFSRVLRTRHALAFTLLSPAVIALTLFTVYPLLYNVQLAFSDLRLKTFPCYMPSFKPDETTTTVSQCPLSGPEEGKDVQVALDGLVLRGEPGDNQPQVGSVDKGTTVRVLKLGAVTPPKSQGSDFLGGGTDTSSKPVDYRDWWQVRLPSGQVGWVPDSVNNVATLKRETVLYSLDYGFQNLRAVFFDVDQDGNIKRDANGNILWGRLIRTESSTFPVLFARTVLWTVLNVIFHLLIGFGLALLMNNSRLRFRGIYRSIILIPWAIPQVIAALTWKGEFHSTYGFVNSMLNEFGIPSVPWLTTPVPAFAAVLFVNVWLGVPFYMVTLLGGLGSISREYYEAAEMDGASPIQRFRHITVPLIRPIAVPIITLDAIWTFNLFNVIYLITEGEPAESTNILVTALYNAAFGRNGTSQLGFAAAFSLLLFLMLLGMVVVWVRATGALKGVYD
jgi:arabinogalactan oligomer/maltooligosaccharide transport system permease protein